MNSSALNIFFIGLFYDLAKKGTILQLQGIMNRKQTVVPDVSSLAGNPVFSRKKKQHYMFEFLRVTFLLMENRSLIILNAILL